MNMTLKKSHLTPARQELLELIQSIDHGKIKGLSIENGQPVLVPPPDIVQEIKLSAADRSRTAVSTDFTLNKETTDSSNSSTAWGRAS